MKHLLIFLLFIFSRIYIYQNPPKYFSDVTNYYMVYADTWKNDITPYDQHLYEYAPATIPLISFPQYLQDKGVGNYYPIYRAQILLIESIFFIIAYVYINKHKKEQKIDPKIKAIAYIVITALAKEFLYEGVDFAFTVSTYIAFIALNSQLKTNVKNLAIWVFIWLSVAIKFLTLPLLAPIWMLRRVGKLKTDLVIPLVGFSLIWGGPLAIWGVNLKVPFWVNIHRPIKYAALPAHVIRWVDVFTNSEIQVMKAPDFEYAGPVSDIVTNIVSIGFPIIMLGFIIWSAKQIITAKHPKCNLETIKKEIKKPKNLNNNIQYHLILKITAVYLFTLFLSAKTFSQPFHIWYMPLILLYPFKNYKQFAYTLALMFSLVLLDMTELLHIKQTMPLIGNLTWNLLRDTSRFIPMILLLVMFSKYEKSLNIRADTS